MKLRGSPIFVLLGFSLLFSVPSVWAQAQGGGQGSGQGQGGGTGRTTPMPQPAPTPQPGPTGPTFERQMPFPSPQEMRRPIYLTGRVILDDGSPAPMGTIIERVCNGIAVPEGYVDSKGRFSFQIGQNANLIPDASFSGMDPIAGPMGGPRAYGTPNFQGVTENELRGCEIRASLPGYRSDVIQLTGRRFLDNPDLGTIVLHRLHDVKGTTISLTSLKAPKNAKKEYESALKDLRNKKWNNARNHLEKALKIYPDYAEAWFALGQLHEQQKEIDAAKQAYQKAIELDPNFVSPYIRLAMIAATNNDWQQVIHQTSEVIRLNPLEFPIAYFLRGVAHFNTKNLEEAEKDAKAAIDRDPKVTLPKARYLMGLVLAQRGEFRQSAQLLRSYLELSPNDSNIDLVKQQLAEVERLAAQFQPQAQATTPAQPQQD